MLIKYSPQDISKLAERLSKFESDIKALKLEKKAHFTSIKDGAIRILDASGNEVAKFGKDNSNYGIWVREGLLKVEDNLGVIRAQLGKISAGVYGVKINDSSGNLLINLYDPANYEIKKPVLIQAAYTQAWTAWRPNDTYTEYAHNLGYIPTHRNAEGNGNPVGISIAGVPGGESYIIPEEFYAAIDICWVSETQFMTYHLTAPTGKCDNFRCRFLR